jgi:hypothetical protein
LFGASTDGEQTFGPVVMLGTNGTLTTVGKTNTATTTAGEEEDDDVTKGDVTLVTKETMN